jgi:4-hydroxybenzoate polyprenyltransferase
MTHDVRGSKVRVRSGAMGALLRSSHPIPAAGVTVVAILLGIAVGLEPWRVAVLGVAVALNQLSVGLSNDWIDAPRDREAGRTDKPVALGLIPVSTVRTVAITSAILSIVVTVPLGLAAMIAHLVVLASAWLYNVGLKKTAVSAVPYLVSFGLLPMVATLAFPDPALPTWWAMAAGALLGLAAHIANVLPDLDDDRRTGIRGLPHRLGVRASTIVAGAALLATVAVLAAGTGLTTVLWIGGLAASVLVSATAIALSFVRSGSRWAFRLVIVAALVDVALLVLSGGRLVA